MTHAMAQGKGMGRYLFWGVAAALLAAALAWSFAPAPVAVDVGTVARGPLVTHVQGEGRTRVKDIYSLSAPVAGRLLRIEAEAGDPVAAGQTQLAVIEPADPTILDKRARAEAEATVLAATDALALAHAEAERAKAELGFARSELGRATRLRETDAISQRAFDLAVLEVATREAALKSAEATAQVRQHELENARARLMTPVGGPHDAACCVAISSPVDGRVLRVLTKSEGVVQAGAPLMELGDVRALEVVVDLLTSDAAQVQEGAKASIANWGGAELPGRVRRIEPYGYTKISVLGVEEQRVDVVIDFADPAHLPAELAHGFRVDVAIETWAAQDALKVPMAALFRVGGGWAAYVNEDGRARLRPLGIGHMNAEEAEALSGLEAGDRVIVHPSDRIGDGVRVEARENGA